MAGKIDKEVAQSQCVSDRQGGRGSTKLTQVPEPPTRGWQNPIPSSRVLSDTEFITVLVDLRQPEENSRKGKTSNVSCLITPYPRGESRDSKKE